MAEAKETQAAPKAPVKAGNPFEALAGELLGVKPEPKQEPEAAPEEPEAAPETQTQEAEAPETEAVETPEPETEAPAQETDEYDPQEVFSRFKGEDGNVDLRKVAKSYKEAQKLIGKTSKDREQLKQLPQLQQAWNQVRYLDQLAAKHPEMLEAIKAAVARETGQQPAKPALTVPVEDLDKKVAELHKQGRYKEAQALINQHDPEFQEVRRIKAELQESRRQEAEASNAKQIQDELTAFKKAHVADGLYDEKGNEKDTELLNVIHELYREGLNASYEDAHGIALKRLGRIGKPVPADPAKKQVINSSARGGRAVPRKTETADDDNEAADEALGFPKGTFAAFAKTKR